MKINIINILLTISVAGFLNVIAEDSHDTDMHDHNRHPVSMQKENADESKNLETEGKTDNTNQLSPQTTCPVMEGKAIDKKFYADHDGKRVYFCCNGCVATFKKDPEKYIKKLESMGQSAEKIVPAKNIGKKKETSVPQTICPVMGGKINKKLYVDHDGRRIYVCCEACIAEIKKDPSLYLQKLESSGQTAEIINK